MPNVGNVNMSYDRAAPVLLPIGPIASGSIISPVEFFDITLPDTYSVFDLVLSGFHFDSLQSLSLAMSFDGGTTFLNDAVNFDSYQSNGYYAQAGMGGSNSNPDSLCDINGSQSTTDLFSGFARVTIVPGSPIDFAYCISLGFSVNTADALLAQYNFIVNPLATVTPTPARTNLVRLLPYGNGDCDPPTSGAVITSGSWTLYGVAGL